VRVAKGIGLNDAARRVGVSNTYLSFIERDRTKTASEAVLRAIAEVYEADPDVVLAKFGRIPADVAAKILECPEVWHKIRGW
jgi:transcriptional regulator with XRE-family HTH domain